MFGNKRVVLANVTAAATGDYYDTGLRVIQGLSAVPPSTTAVTPNADNVTNIGRVTFNYSGGGGMTGIIMMAVGI